ncbi:hypothetical protein CI109_105468 [Kwoniella shandongensis]|uniref:Uncharacterized protein n=1 Tax=Kwoniella shandongensis TaxID=1734106 RepID=A0A5M6C2E7_9TREE|nr:uncharacterized protein CI109_002189 [Kwoniella shandongensis]KAA5529296.1 hypothetical protein CI109_002189 [Kwoniella shandongensis]
MSDNEAGPSRPSTSKSGSQWYIHYLDSHIDSSRRHIQGQPGRGNHHTPVGQFLSYASYVPPTDAVWTSEEKTLFFAALSRYSRHRVDLIARDVGTKTQVEVEWYLDLLTLGDEKRQITDRKMDLRDRRVRWDSSQTWRTGLAPAAREVSQKWIQKEEILSNEVVKIVNGREEEHAGKLKGQRRRAEKRAIGQSIHDQVEMKPYEKRMLIEEGSLAKSLEKRWELEDWIEDIDTEKLGTLNKLLQPAWSDWYGQRIHTPSPSRARVDLSSDSESDSDDRTTQNQHVNGTTNFSPVKGDPQGKIARDRHDFAVLSAIPKKDRNREQHRQLAAIVNRQRAREKYRTKKLLEEGMSLEEIAKAGGADVIFTKRDAGGDSAQGSGNVLAEAPVRTKPKTPQEIAADDLKSKGVYEHATACGLEVFNYEWMTRVLNRISPTAPRHISFLLLHQLYSQLVDFLRPLLYRAVVIAEQNFMLGTIPDSEPHMTSEHVQQALALLGTAPPFGSLEDTVASLFRDDNGGVLDQEEEDESDSEPDPANVRRARYPRSVHPPSQVPWDMMPDLAPSDMQDKESHNDENQILDYLSDAATEQEDAKMDETLDKLDEAHDRLYEAGLWKAVKSDDPTVEPNDGGDVWMARTTQRLLGGRARRRTPMEKAYIQLLMKISEERRKRRLDVRRQRKFPTTRLRVAARKNKGAKTDAYIIDSDVDSDSDDAGEDVNYDELDDDTDEDDEEEGMDVDDLSAEHDVEGQDGKAAAVRSAEGKGEQDMEDGKGSDDDDEEMNEKDDEVYV